MDDVAKEGLEGEEGDGDDEVAACVFSATASETITCWEGLRRFCDAGERRAEHT